MEALELLAAGTVLVVAVGVGTVAHELSHAITLRALGVSCEVTWLPGGDAGGMGAIGGSFATVTPTDIPCDLAPWRLRVAALMPLILAVPIPLVLLGIVPDPLAVGDPLVVAATIGWLACGLPSHQDFSLVMHADTALERYSRTQ